MEPCDGCKQPEHCTGYYPDSDKHRPGQIRGCFGSKTKSLHVATCAGKPTHYGTDVVPNTSWENGIAGETRRDGSFTPYLSKEGLPIHVKEYGENRFELEQLRRRQLEPSIST